MTKTNIKRGDTVVVIAGKDKGKKGKVMAVMPEENRCVVDGVNTIIKHKKARSAQQKSAREKKTGTIDISNVQILCKCGKATRVSHKVINGKSIRYCNKCEEILDKKYVKAAKDAKAKEKEIEGEKETETTKKPLERRQVKSTADVKVKKPTKVTTSSNVSLPKKMGG